jgi:hypothetical protein
MSTSVDKLIFCKRYTCPSAETLLLYQMEKDRYSSASRVRRHLAECDFCSAEMQLLKRYPNINETYKPVEMPLHLQVLAQNLFSQLKQSRQRRRKRYSNYQPQPYT